MVARGGAVHRRDDRLLQAPQGEDRPVVRAAQPMGDVAGRLAELSQILADAEPTAGAGHDHGAHLVGARFLVGVLNRAVHGGVEGVQHVRPVERDREDAAVPIGLHLGHVPSSLAPSTTKRRCVPNRPRPGV